MGIILIPVLNTPGERGASPIYQGPTANGLIPTIGSTRGDAVAEDSFEFVPVDPTLDQSPDGLTPNIGSTCGDVVSGDGSWFEPLTEYSDGLVEIPDSHLLDSMTEGESCGV